MIRVLANGCFDVLHVGHLWHLEAAKAMGDRLIVSLTLDAHVNKGPGKPIHPWAHRAEMLRALRCVDEVIASESAVQSIQTVKPNIFVKGIDYEGQLQVEQLACDLAGAELRITRSPKMGSGDILRRMQQDFSAGARP